MSAKGREKYGSFEIQRRHKCAKDKMQIVD